MLADHTRTSDKYGNFWEIQIILEEGPGFRRELQGWLCAPPGSPEELVGKRMVLQTWDKTTLNFLQEQEFTHPGFLAWGSRIGLGMLREFLLIPRWSSFSVSPCVAEHPRCPTRLLGEFYIPRYSVLNPGLKSSPLQRLSGICWEIQISSASGRIQQEVLGQEAVLVLLSVKLPAWN